MSSFLSVKQTTTTMQRQLNPPTRKAEVQRVRNKQVIVLVDESYSMKGDRWKRTVGGTQGVLMSLPENSYFGLYAFGSEFRECYEPMNISKEGVGKNAKGKAYATRRAEINGSIMSLDPALTATRMFDSVLEAFQKFKKPPADYIKVQLELIVLTDGGDNRSTKTASEINRILRGLLKASPWMDQFTLTVLAVAMDDSATRKCQELVAGMGEVASIGEHEIKDTFDTVVKKIQARAVVITETTTKTETVCVRSGVGVPVAAAAAAVIGGGGRKAITQGSVSGLKAIAASSPLPTATPVACKFGSACTKAGCKFNHPNAAASPELVVECKFGSACTKSGCKFLHASASASTSVCKFGAGCAKSGCKFLHPPGKSKSKVGSGASKKGK